ncbi:MAG: alpha-mannosidase, partial [Lachnospiraceae bacterium]|nr:alpha-mannosidase [Lachnospiraceae bacterium]
MEPIINKCKGYLNTIGQQIYCAEYPADKILCKKIGYNRRNTILEDTSNPGWEPFENGSRFGGRDTHACFRTVFHVSEECEGREIWFLLRTGVTDIWNSDNPQFLIYVNGEIRTGMDMNHHELCLTKCAVPGENFDIGIYAYSNSINISDYFRVIFREKKPEVEKYYYDYKVPLDVCLQLRPDDVNRIAMLKILDEAVNRTYLVKVPSEEFYESIRNMDAWLKENLYDKLCDPEAAPATVHSIGHTHIDVAWKWPVRQTREKALRSFSTVLRFMDEYPAYRFMSSQPQLYKFVKEDAPEVFEKIKKRVKEGRWETEGAMWLEADCNLTSGESLVRQILKGKEFFNEEFGTGDANRVLWLPDVFGYSAALPQILRKSGVDYFMTTKIGWNEFNKMPHDVMNWRGIDGSEVLTYFISTTEYNTYPELVVNPRHETTYNGRHSVSQIMGTWQRFSDKELTDDVLTCYGYGDGGGGPSSEMLEIDRRMNEGLPGVPVTKQTFSKEFFELLAKDLEGKKVPKWSGELYLEYHRGTYTSMAKNKKFNRLVEFMNFQAEALSVLACVNDEKANYPRTELDSVWETTLLNQFHDILPGSSIKEVYEVTEREYSELIERDKEIINTAVKSITGEAGPNIAVYNTLSFDRDALVETPNGPLYVGNIPAMGYLVIDGNLCPPAEPVFTFDREARTLQTPFYQVSFDEEGEICSLYDKQAGREAVKAGETFNRIIAFEDRPWEYDCWNIDTFYEDKPMKTCLTGFEAEENTHERFTILMTRNFADSVITQRISFYRGSRRIDFKTHIDWKEQQILLKAAFPVDVVTDKCTCDIQFGNVERPTHRNTSWDEARFEICSHKWVDVAENGYGVAVMSDCKYGSDVKESTVRLTLLKSGIFPNPDADKGEHEFVYSVFPHIGDFRESAVEDEAFKLNVPVIPVPTALPAGEQKSSVNIDSKGIYIDALKEAEDKRGIILRVHEAYGRRRTVNIDVSALNVKKADLCDLMEREIDSELIGFSEGRITVTIKP